MQLPTVLSARRGRVRPPLSLSCRSAFLVLLVAATLVGSARAEVAQPGVTGDVARQAHEIAESLMSPFCPGMTLAACPSQGAADLRDELRLRLGDGEPQAAVVADFVERFGSQVTGVPGKRGFEALAWVLPLAGGAGILLLVRLLGFRRPSSNQKSDPLVDTAMSARLDEELLQLDT